jgi:hypothetical protein
MNSYPDYYSCKIGSDFATNIYNHIRLVTAKTWHHIEKHRLENSWRRSENRLDVLAGEVIGCRLSD